MKLSDIKVNPKNPRTIKDGSFKKLVKSIQDFPQMMELRPIVMDENNIVQGGNMRYKALKELGYKEIPDSWVKKGGDLTKEQWEEFVIKDNVGFGDWDINELKTGWDINKLEEWGLELEWDVNKKQDVDEDGFEGEANIETDIQAGDLFQIGRHKLLCGDATKEYDYRTLLGGIKSDLIFTDPPYDLEDNYSTLIFDVAKDDSHIFIMNSDKLLVENVNNGFNWFRKFFAVDFRQARLVSNNQPMTRVDLIAEFCKGKTKFNNLYDGFSTLIECSKIHNKNETINFGHKQAKKNRITSYVYRALYKQGGGCL